MAYFMGIDIGSVYSKGVITRDDKISASHVIISGADYGKTAETIRQALLKKAGLSHDQVAGTVATGSGAGKAQFTDKTVSDMVCTARGIKRIFPSAKTVIDVAAQSTRMMLIDGEGLVANFVFSEKCAAGSGRFIEIIANVLRIDLEEFGPLSLQSENPITFGTGCAVFGESEAVTRVSEGISKEDIAGGVNKALADKTASLAKKLQMVEPCAICGGGALNVGLIQAIEHELNIRLLVSPQPQIMAALGAAIMAKA